MADDRKHTCDESKVKTFSSIEHNDIGTKAVNALSKEFIVRSFSA